MKDVDPNYCSHFTETSIEISELRKNDNFMSFKIKFQTFDLITNL